MFVAHGSPLTYCVGLFINFDYMFVSRWGSEPLRRCKVLMGDEIASLHPTLVFDAMEVHRGRR